MKSLIRAQTIDGLPADPSAGDTRGSGAIGSLALDRRGDAQALLAVLALSQREMEEGRVTPVADVLARLRAKRLTK